MTGARTTGAAAYVTVIRALPPAIAAQVNPTSLRDECARLVGLGYDGPWVARLASVGIATADKPGGAVIARLREITDPAPQTSPDQARSMPYDRTVAEALSIGHADPR